jgi:hypothetical protein
MLPKLLARNASDSYQWDEPFAISDRRFRERFRQEAADVDQVAAATVACARQHYATTLPAPLLSEEKLQQPTA